MITRMCLFALLLYIVFFAAPDCTGLPTNAEYISNSILGITNLAKVTQVHTEKLSKELQVGAEINLSPPSIQGLTGISRDLGLLYNELHCPFTELLGQIQVDVSSLERAVRSLASTMDCPTQDKPQLEIREHPYPHSHLKLTLMKVKCYLDHLLLNMDKLEVC